MKRALPIQVLLGVTLLAISAVLLVMLWLYQQQNVLRAEHNMIGHHRLGVSQVLFAVEDRAEQMQRLARLAASSGELNYIQQHARLRLTIQRFHDLIAADLPADLATPSLHDDDLRDWTDALNRAQLSRSELNRLNNILEEILDWSGLQAEAIAELTPGATANDTLRFLASADQELANWRNGALLEELEFQALQRLRRSGERTLAKIDRLRYWEAVNLGSFAFIILLAMAVFQALAVRPLKKALNAASRIGGGAYDVRIRPTGVEEMQALGHTLNWMADAIQADIQARLEAENRAREMESRIRQVGDLAPGAIWSSRWTREKGLEIFYISEGFDKLYALGGKSIIDDVDNLYKSIHPDDRELTKRIYIESAKNLGEIDFQHRSLRPDGEYRWTRVVAHVTALQGGGLGWNGYCMDVHEIQRLRESTESALQRAQAASQAKTTFLANISHEVRTPLNAIIGIADVALLEQQPPDLKRKFERIQGAGKQLLKLLNDVLDTSKLEAGRVGTTQEDFALQTVVNNLRALHEDAARSRKLKLLTIIDSSCPAWVKGDALRLQQILGNLLSNALKFTPHGEVRLHIQVSLEPRRDNFCWLRFTVSDTGPGIPEEKQHLLFEAFTQEDDSISRTHGGTGLGLTICRQLTELLGGSIEVQSTPGKGSSFVVSLPFEAASAPEKAAQDPRPARPTAATLPSTIPTLSTEQITTLAAMIKAGDAAARTQLPQWCGDSLPATLALLQKDLDSFDFERAGRRLARLRHRAS